MSDFGNSEFSSTPGQAAGQPAPGWYFAQGDPPGTERYWSGSEWEGSYRAVGGFTPTEIVAPPSFPAWAKVLAWILTGLKVIPVLLLALLVALWGAVTAELENELDFEFREFSIIILVIGLAFVVLGLVLLLGQLVSVMKEQPGRAAIWGGIHTLIDAVFALGALSEGGLGNGGLFVGILACQGGLFAYMVKLWNDQKSTTVDTV